MPAAPLPERFSSGRLELRVWASDDAAVLNELVARNIEHLRPFLAWVADEPQTLAQRAVLIETWRTTWRAGADAHYAVHDRGEVIGTLGMMRRRGPRVIELGYWIDAGHTRRGIATAAAGAATLVALASPGIDAVQIHHDKANVASGAVARKLGYTFVGEAAEPALAPGESGIECIWRATASGYDPRRVPVLEG
jgi:RimJ/RimL family protein N-acetyltransferase